MTSSKSTDDTRARALAALDRIDLYVKHDAATPKYYETKDTIRAALQQREPVDLNALKKPSGKGQGFFITDYNQGWNDCIDHLKAKGVF